MLLSSLTAPDSARGEPNADLSHLEILAGIDLMAGELRAWGASAPEWPAGRASRALIERLMDRTELLKVRLDAPLVVATLGGTGTGKSALINALVGIEVAPSGRQRPTTREPVLICRQGLGPEALGIDPALVRHVPLDRPVLRDLVLLDCPDPDTTEDQADTSTNLSRLRRLLPHCDVLLVVGTQQKYRSARVTEELLDAARGARLIFVQTHADVDTDIRQDWRKTLGAAFEPGGMFFVDSPAALAQWKAGKTPDGEFGRLLDLLTRELSGAAARRIRRANFVDLAAGALAMCQERIAADLPAVMAVESAIGEQRKRLAASMAAQLREGLLTNRRAWENRLVAEISARWGFSPFSLVLRAWQGLGGLVSGLALFRARSAAQVALWGAFEGVRQVRRYREERDLEELPSRGDLTWDEAELRKAGVIVDGYLSDAGLDRSESAPERLSSQVRECSSTFLNVAAGDLQGLLGRLATGNSGWMARLGYEVAFSGLLILLLYRLGRNFFWDSWLAGEFGGREVLAPLLGGDFFLQAGFWLLAWVALLLWAFTSRLRRGMQGEVNSLASQWSNPSLAGRLLAKSEALCRDVRRFRDDAERLANDLSALRNRLDEPVVDLGHRRLP